MNEIQKAFAKAAETLIGSPFRLRGRDPATGIDCIGLVHCALVAIGKAPPPLPRYTLRNAAIDELLDLLPSAGFVTSEGALRSGELCLFKPSPAQFHLAIAHSSQSLVHAHAGLGRVVASPINALPAIQQRWRLA